MFSLFFSSLYSRYLFKWLKGFVNLLESELSAYINGANIPIDGGLIKSL